MEGTRHERVVVLITAYVIGFITAYIAFGVIKVQDFDYQTFTNQSATVLNAQQENNDADIFVGMNHEGLYVLKNNKKILLSLKDTEDIIPGEGVHYAITTYSISPDNSKVYFCEQPTADSDSCRPYIYSMNDAMVYPVTIQGERVAFPVDTHKVLWNNKSELLIE